MNREQEWLLDEKYDGVESEAFHADLERLARGEPLGYIIGHVPFLDCQISLDSHPLIPRPETEFWVEKAISAGRELSKVELSKVGPSTPSTICVLDLCAGSGAIGVAFAKAIPEAFVDFAEIDPSHLPTIKKNISQNLSSRQDLELEDKYRVVEANLFETSSRQDLELGKYDFILTNPPYIDPIIDRTEKSVKDFEPHLALYGGNDGMELIEKIIAEAPQHLNEGGQLWIEHEPEQVEAIHKCAEASSFRVSSHPDQYGVPRYSILTHT